ncbi:MAG: DNA repair protein RecN [Deltaproteobacteria bacterium]|nr:DNA repair protein RecN [Deltaproteobacteria bacterium]
MGRIILKIDMLEELRIKNFAIIDELKTSFPSGLTVMSGETGAGKSIIIGAVSLLLGDRASVDMIRTSEDSAHVEALFGIRGKEKIKEKLADMGFYEGDELVIKRVVSRTGKNKAYINGNLATMGMLTSLSEYLLNICGQHEHQFILKSDNHIDILDEFGDLLHDRKGFTVCYGKYLALEKRLEGLESKNREKHAREELLAYQLKEIEEGNPEIGEDQALLEEKKIVINAKKLRECADESHDILYVREGAILEQFTRVISCVKEIKDIDTELMVSRVDLDSMYYNLEETAFALRDYGKKLEFNPARLAEIEERLELLGSLKRKYGGSIGNVLDKRKKIEEELNDILSLEEEIGQISNEISDLKKELLHKARNLSQKRREAAERLEAEIEREIHSMRMENTKFAVRFIYSAGDGEANPEIHSRGIDEAEFYLSTNVGEEMKPLNRIASGGELSRIMLAMKKVLARTGSTGTVIFDEVDSGIGGAVAEVIGRKLRDVAQDHQVICITHLPQIACFGKAHFLVSKKVEGDRTNTEVTLLDKAKRIDEITRMLGGVNITEKTREHAMEMLEGAHKN